MFSTESVEKIRTRVLCHFLKNHNVYEIMWEKYGKARHATNDNMYGACALHAG
jgi:hypothetical protein